VIVERLDRWRATSGPRCAWRIDISMVAWPTALSGGEVARKGPADRVPVDAPKPGALAGAPQRVLALLLRQAAAAVIAEDDLAFELAVGLERREDILAERDLARSA
jgi:hypothetical protein